MYQIILLFTLGKFKVIYQLYFNKTGVNKKKKRTIGLCSAASPSRCLGVAGLRHCEQTVPATACHKGAGSHSRSSRNDTRDSLLPLEVFFSLVFKHGISST